MAFDNSLEFVNDEIIREKLDTKINFSNPYTSWKREINELIKQYSLRGPEFNKVSNRKINFFANGINNRLQKIAMASRLMNYLKE